jgi:DNA-binding PadR family transcriptional regulator
MRDRKRHSNQSGGRQGREEGNSDAFGARGKGRRRHDRHGRGRGRAGRGDARLIILDALRDSPKHGYEIIKALEERSAGQYVPSPGTVYPTLQYLEDQGFVRATQEGERRIYQLTEAGQTELDAQAEQVTDFWERFAGQGVAPATHHEVRFLQDELEHLNRMVWSELRPAIAQGRQDAIRRVRGAVEACQDQIREIIATEQKE